MIPHKLKQKVQNDENIYINREIIIKLSIKNKNNKGEQRKCSSICKNLVINIKKNPIILRKEIINNCMLSNKRFFFFFSFENDSTKHRSAQKHKSIQILGANQKKHKPNKNLPNKNKNLINTIIEQNRTQEIEKINGRLGKKVAKP